MTPAVAAPAATGGSSADLVPRYAVVVAVVGAWMALGAALHVDGNTYLLMGVPLLVIFQRFIARRPLRELWFAQPVSLALPWWGWLIAGAFTIWPLHEILTRHDASWAIRLWLVCAIGGAVPLAISLVRCARSGWRELGFCFLTAGAVGTLTMGLGFAVHHSAGVAIGHRLGEGLRSFALYWPVCFALEEVFFRGGLDSYLSRDGNRAPWVSAFFVSAVWGWWHLPIVPLRAGNHAAQLAGLLVILPLVHCSVGMFFSFYWRRSGLLFVPATVHAFIDAVRNALH